MRGAVLLLLVAGSVYAQDALERGKKVYQQAGCMACHRIQGKGGPTGPDLTRIGAGRTAPAWYRKFLKDPASVNPSSRMPSYEDLSNEEVRALTAYLMSLK